MNQFVKELRRIFTTAVRKESYDGLLFSGGLDTAVLAAIKPEVKCVTVTLEDKAEDTRYADLVSKSFDLKHFYRKVGIKEAIDAIPEVIRMLKSFDPAIPNDLAVYFGIQEAKKLGINKITTGDGSDEIFAGYSFMRGVADLSGYIERIASSMSFSSNVIADSLGIGIRQPFIDKEVVEFALEAPNELKICEDKGEVWGKWILRKAFEDMIPREIAWQSKRPLEYGSGMNYLRSVLSKKISEEEYKDNTYGIKFLNREHLYYYKIYRDVIGEIPKPKEGEKQCPGCGTGISQGGFHCKLCGHVINVEKEVI